MKTCPSCASPAHRIASECPQCGTDLSNIGPTAAAFDDGPAQEASVFAFAPAERRTANEGRKRVRFARRRAADSSGREAPPAFPPPVSTPESRYQALLSRVDVKSDRALKALAFLVSLAGLYALLRAVGIVPFPLLAWNVGSLLGATWLYGLLALCGVTAIRRPELYTRAIGLFTLAASALAFAFALALLSRLASSVALLETMAIAFCAAAAGAYCSWILSARRNDEGSLLVATTVAVVVAVGGLAMAWALAFHRALDAIARLLGEGQASASAGGLTPSDGTRTDLDTVLREIGVALADATDRRLVGALLVVAVFGSLLRVVLRRL